MQPPVVEVPAGALDTRLLPGSWANTTTALPTAPILLQVDQALVNKAKARSLGRRVHALAEYMVVSLPPDQHHTANVQSSLSSLLMICYW